MNKPTITIIIATYNAESFLQRCLNSIRSQKDFQTELLLIDGNSKDSTVDIIKKNKDIIDFSVSEKDKGVYDAWNKGIHQAKGKWIMFLGADDILLPEALQAYFTYFEESPFEELDIISSRLDLVNEKGQHMRFVGEKFDHTRYCQRQLSFAHPGMLHSRNMLLSMGGFSTDYRICSDAEFFIKNGATMKSGFVDYVTVRMQQGGMSVSFAAIQEAYEIRKKYNVINPISNFIGLIKISIMFLLSRVKTKFFA